jgi:diadenylate cyclase
LGGIIDFLRHHYILDLLDILIVAFLFYRIYLIFRGTRAIQMFVGLAIMFAFSLVAQSLGLLLVNQIIVSLQTVWLVAFIIIFQPELRGALSYLGRTRVFQYFVRERQPEVVEQLVRTAINLSRAGLGAIIVVQRNTGLKPHIETGTRIGAKVSAALLETIFTPPTPLHDGAVIIRGDEIVAAACILPLSRNEQLAYTLGTRHRAALGLSEESDAFVVVVSEENRQISVAEEGRLRRRLSADDLRAELTRIYGRAEDLAALHLPTAEPIPKPQAARRGGEAAAGGADEDGPPAPLP